MIAAASSILSPVITLLGTLCLIALVAGGSLYVIFWLISRLWKPIVFLSSCVVLVAAAYLILSTIG